MVKSIQFLQTWWSLAQNCFRYRPWYWKEFCHSYLDNGTHFRYWITDKNCLNLNYIPLCQLARIKACHYKNHLTFKSEAINLIKNNNLFPYSIRLKIHVQKPYIIQILN
jgi:hypothetical protein